MNSGLFGIIRNPIAKLRNKTHPKCAVKSRNPSTFSDYESVKHVRLCQQSHDNKQLFTCHQIIIFDNISP
jgi:hypothetical protein